MVFVLCQVLPSSLYYGWKMNAFARYHLLSSSINKAIGFSKGKDHYSRSYKFYGRTLYLIGEFLQRRQKFT
jgi:hypothetical protein